MEDRAEPGSGGAEGGDGPEEREDAELGGTANPSETGTAMADA